MTQPWRGIFVIVATPFTDSYELDEASLRNGVRFCIDADVHGLVGPAFASEFPMLSDEERMRWIQIVIDEASGQLPVIATTHSVHTVPAVAFSRAAQQMGADGIMIMPPHLMHFRPEQCFDHYRALSDALDVPVIIQNMVGPIGTPLGAELLARMCRELEQIQYIKEERLPEPSRISETLDQVDESCKGVFGGRNGTFMIDEYRRGACGNMPGAGTPDLHVDIWNKLESGDEAGARDLFNRALPALLLNGAFGPSALKETLYRRGVFATNKSRTPGHRMDARDLAEYETQWTALEPLLRL